jgi:hypothetical protein
MSVPYRYDRFQRQLLYHDVRFEGGPAPGELFPDFDLPTVGGGRLDRAEATRGRPMLIVSSSFT